MSSGATAHGAKRLAKRRGLGSKAVGRAIETAREQGMPREATTGRLRRYLDRGFHDHGGSSFMVVYSGDVYVFNHRNGALVTVYSLPGNLKHTKASRATGRSLMHGDPTSKD